MRHSSRLRVGQRFEHRRHQRPKDGDIVARNINNDHSDRKAQEALLILEVAIDSEQNVELRGREL
jgi:hypothetical protein